MYSLHNSTAISLPALSLIADLITCRIWHEESPSYRHWILMPIRLDGRLFPLAVLTSHCVFCVFVCVCWFYHFLENQKGDLSPPLYPTMLSTCWHLRNMRRYWMLCGTGVFCQLLGHQQTRKRESSSEPVSGVSGRREWKRIGGSSEVPLSRSTEQSGDQSGLFYVAGVILWSLRVTYSTHFIKFTSVLIADQ